MRARLQVEIEEVAADKEYHKAETLAECWEWGVRTYIPEQKRMKRTWTAFALVLWLWTVLGDWIDQWYSQLAMEVAPASGNVTGR